jgi:hypothetical protein
MTATDVVRQIVASLGETEPRPIRQIEQIVEVLGELQALGLLARTEVIEHGGGMTLPNGVRRTPGGVFFRLAKKALPFKDRQRIFLPDAASPVAEPPVAAAKASATPRADTPDPNGQRLVRVSRSRAPASEPAPPSRDEAAKPATPATRIAEQLARLLPDERLEVLARAYLIASGAQESESEARVHDAAARFAAAFRSASRTPRAGDGGAAPTVERRTRRSPTR